MPLHELVLKFPDGHVEVRLTDRECAAGEVLEIGYTEWRLVRKLKPQTEGAATGFLCELAAEQRASAEKHREDAAELERLRLLDDGP